MGAIAIPIDHDPSRLTTATEKMVATEPVKRWVLILNENATFDQYIAISSVPLNVRGALTHCSGTLPDHEAA